MNHRPVAAGATEEPKSPGSFWDFDGGHVTKYVRQLREGMVGIAPDVSIDANIEGAWRLDHSNPTWHFRLHSFGFLNELSNAYIATGDPEIPGAAEHLVAGWQRDCGIPDDTAPWHGHQTALRASALAAAADIGVLDRAKYLELLRVHAAWLAEDEHYDGAWNHGLDQCIALIDVSYVLEDEAFAGTAIDRIVDAIEEYVDDEGVVSEQAVHYAGYMYTRLRLVQQKLACLTVELPPVFERVELIPEFLQWATRPDGHAVPLGDTQSGPWSSLIPELVRTQSTRGGAHRPSGNHRIYRDGWAFYRSGWEGWERGEPAADSLLTVRYGTFRRIHGHRDHTSITWYSSGGTVIEDPGFSGYEDRNQRISEQGESSHNGVVLEGAGRFRWENGSPILRQSTSYFGTEHEPVHSLVVGGISYVEASRIRSIVHVPSRQIVIVHDVVNAKCDVSASTRWLLSPDFTISDSHCDDRQVGFRDGDRELVVRVLQKDVEVEVSGAQDGSAGRIATDLGTFRTCPVIKTGATGREPEMTAVFSLERGLAVEEIGGARMGWSLRFPDGEAVQILRAGDIGLNVEVTRPLLTRKYDHLG